LQLIIKQIKRDIHHLDEQVVETLREWFVVNRNCNKQAVSQPRYTYGEGAQLYAEK